MHSKCKALRMLVALDDCITYFVYEAFPQILMLPRPEVYLTIIYSLTKFGAFSNCELHN